MDTNVSIDLRLCLTLLSNGPSANERTRDSNSLPFPGFMNCWMSLDKVSAIRGTVGYYVLSNLVPKNEELTKPQDIDLSYDVFDPYSLEFLF